MTSTETSPKASTAAGPGPGRGSRRPSRQRTSLRAYLSGQPAFRTAQEIHADLRDQGERVGLATVYRALQAMAIDGEVDMLRTPDGEQAYRVCDTERHHHHLVCRGCGVTEEVTDPPVQQWAAAVAREHGFTDVEHHVEVFGTCRRCGAG